MSLGPDGTICASRLKEAMRARLEAQTPGSGANVDSDAVEPNFEALGKAVWQILTTDSQVMDPAFWTWVAGLSAWAAAMRTWQQQMSGAFTAWAPAIATDVTLRTAIIGLAAPPVLSAVPTAADGKIL